MNRVQTILACATAAVLSSAGAARAADFTIDLPAGLACAFELRIEGTGGNQHMKEFVDKNGGVRVLSAGTGSALTFTNLDTGASLSLRSNGAVQQVTLNADGSQTVTSMGHNVLILFPSDIPAGPTTTLYVGRLVYTVDSSSGIFTVLGNSGQATDICAALS